MKPKAQMNWEDEDLREYVREEFVKSGFIEVSQWRNFIDYLQILLKNEYLRAKEDTLKEVAKQIDEVYLEGIQSLGKLDYTPDAMGAINSFKLILKSKLGISEDSQNKEKTHQ